MQNTISKQKTWQIQVGNFSNSISGSSNFLKGKCFWQGNCWVCRILWPLNFLSDHIYMGLLMEKEVNVNEWINWTFDPIYFGRQTLSFIYFERRKLLRIIAKYTKRRWFLYFCTLRGRNILYVVGTYIPSWPTTIRVGLIPTGELGLLPVYVLHVCGWGLPQLNSSSLNIKSRKKHVKEMSSVQFLFVSF